MVHIDGMVMVHIDGMAMVCTDVVGPYRWYGMVRTDGMVMVCLDVVVRINVICHWHAA